MTWVAVAVGAGAVVSGVAANRAGSRAASASQQGTNASIAEQGRQYDQTRRDNSGRMFLGDQAGDTLARLYGWAPASQAADREAANAPLTVGDTNLPAGTTTRDIGGGWSEVWYGGQRIGSLRPGGANGRFVNDTGFDVQGAIAQRAQQGSAQAAPTGRPDLGAFFESPDYQFNLGEGQKAIDRSLAARGGALSGASVRESTRYASGMASQQFGDYTNRLLTIAGLGNAATSNVTQAGMNMANNNSNALLNNANARASSYMTQAQGVNNAVQGGISNYLLSQYLNKPPITTPTVPKV